MFNKKRKARRGTQKAAGNDKEKYIVHKLYTDERQMSINFKYALGVYVSVINDVRNNKRLRKRYPELLPLLEVGYTLLDEYTPERILQDVDNPGAYCCPRCFHYVADTNSRCGYCGTALIPKHGDLCDFEIRLNKNY